MADVTRAVTTAVKTKLATFVLALLVGLGIGAMASPSQVTVPAIGSISTLFPGGAAVLVGGGTLLARDRLSSSGCGYSGDCGC